MWIERANVLCPQAMEKAASVEPQLKEYLLLAKAVSGGKRVSLSSEHGLEERDWQNLFKYVGSHRCSSVQEDEHGLYFMLRPNISEQCDFWTVSHNFTLVDPSKVKEVVEPATDPEESDSEQEYQTLDATKERLAALHTDSKDWGLTLMGTHSVQSPGLRGCRLSADLRNEFQLRHWERSLEREGFTGELAEAHLIRDACRRAQCPTLQRLGEAKQPPNSMLWSILTRTPHYVEGPEVFADTKWDSEDGVEKRSVLIGQLGVDCVALVMAVHSGRCAIATLRFVLHVQWIGKYPFTKHGALVAVGVKPYKGSAWDEHFEECKSRGHLLHMFLASKITTHCSWYESVRAKLGNKSAPNGGIRERVSEREGTLCGMLLEVQTVHVWHAHVWHAWDAYACMRCTTGG